jgi:hypothetical protein
MCFNLSDLKELTFMGDKEGLIVDNEYVSTKKDKEST